MKTWAVIAGATLAVLTVSGARSYAQSAEGAMGMEKGMVMKKSMGMDGSPAAIELGKAMRTLWEDHIVYTRNYIISALAGLEDAGPVAERLMKNQDQIGEAVKPYYGEEAGKKLAILLREHISLAAEVVGAAKSGVKEQLEAANKKWYANSDAIAAFLSGANPHWTKEALTGMLYKHLELTTGEVVSRLQKDWTADIDFYDRGHAHMLMFSDALTDGIVKQFPDRFQK